MQEERNSKLDVVVLSCNSSTGEDQELGVILSYIEDELEASFA